MIRPEDMQTHRISLHILPKYIDLIEHCLKASGTDKAKLLKEIEAVLSGAYQVWGLFEKKADSPLVLGALCVSLVRESGVFEIRGIEGYTVIHKEAWLKAWESLAEFAKKNGCSKVWATTDNPRILKICEALGWDAQTRLIQGVI